MSLYDTLYCLFLLLMVVNILYQEVSKIIHHLFRLIPEEKCIQLILSHLQIDMHDKCGKFKPQWKVL